mmetsp:Transcript_144879/g.464376  ORF Transcript_144879/g.464376 Transcript_144879/m.464376 type:complete len:183 (-) Transcript_144879:42-590(-)
MRRAKCHDEASSEHKSNEIILKVEPRSAAGQPAQCRESLRSARRVRVADDAVEQAVTEVHITEENGDWRVPRGLPAARAEWLVEMKREAAQYFEIETVFIGMMADERQGGRSERPTRLRPPPLAAWSRRELGRETAYAIHDDTAVVSSEGLSGLLASSWYDETRGLGSTVWCLPRAIKSSRT